MANRRLPVYFESRQDNAAKITTDATGYYCIVWASEPFSPGAYLSSNYSVNLGYWRQGSPPAGCENSNVPIPWDHAGDYKSSWQWKALIATPVLALALLLIARLLRLPPTSRLYPSGAALALTSLVLVLTLWSWR